MLETEEQRRWWFATHPEFSRSRKGGGSRKGREETEGHDKVRPEAVDAYVDRMLPYQDGPVADLLRSIKRNFGTKGEARKHYKKIAQADGPRPPSDDEASNGGADDDDKRPTFRDTILQGMDNTFQRWELWLGRDIGLASFSRKLPWNLERAGNPRPSGHHAHHIVPTSDRRFPEAIEARKILEKFKIGIDSADNGVWLPGTAPTGPGAYHPGVHTRKYYAEALRRLRQATTRQQLIETLERVGPALSKGTFPR